LFRGAALTPLKRGVNEICKEFGSLGGSFVGLTFAPVTGINAARTQFSTVAKHERKEPAKV
jgi:hypothetical protein